LKKVTMQQIAEQVGISKFAVSQALSGKPGVAEETRMRIVQAANELGYFRKVMLAKKLSNSSVDGKGIESNTVKSTVIILMPDVRFQSRESFFWGRIIDGVSTALAEREIGVMMVTENYSERSLKSINPDGVLGLIGVGYIATNLLLEIRHMRIPVILIDHEDILVPSDTVFMNNYDCMRQLTTLVVQSGHRDMRFVGNPQYSRSFHDRWLGFRIASEVAKLPVPVPEEDVFLQLDDDAAYIIVEQEINLLVKENRLPSVFVCANDFLAYLVVQTLQAQGVQVPDTVSVTGFDQTDEYTEYPLLSTIQVPNEMMGKRAVEMLFSRLGDAQRPFEKTLINGDLIMRESFRKIDK
jgi:LacI family transcriptional regulator